MPTTSAKSVRKLDYVFDELTGRLAAREWNVGERIPTEIELAKEYGCARGTVNRAIERMVHEGLLERKTRSGTRVLRNHIRQNQAPLELDACALIYPNELHEGIRRISQGFQDAAARDGSRILMMTTGLDTKKESEMVSRLSEFDVKGAAIFPVTLGPQERLDFTRMVLACKFPVVLLQTLMPDTGCYSVSVDGLHAGFTMTKYLLGQGLRRVGFFGNYGWSLLIREKHTGYRQAMYEAGLDDVCQELSYLQLEMNPDFDKPSDEPEEIARDYLEAHPDLEAVVCASDYMALGVMDAAIKMGKRVPEDLRIVGIDGFESIKPQVALTSYRVPYEKIGELSLDLLHKIIRGEQSGLREVQLRGELVVRDSG